MSEPAKILPHYKHHIQENWNNYKHHTASKLKNFIVQFCQPLTDAENKGFAKWLDNQKTNESKRFKRQQSKGSASTNTSTSIPATSNIENTSQIKSISDGVSELAIEEKKQDQNLELFLNDGGQLVQNLLQWTTEEDKLNFLRSQLQSNFMVLYKFMRSRHGALQGFLELVLTLCKELETEEQHKQTILFTRICALHQKEQLEVTKDLIKNAIIELAYKVFDEQAAYGLLKLSYLHDISFKTFPLDSLNRFQERYQMSLKRFLLYLEGQVDDKPQKCLPLTCFIFTHPFYNLLKDSGALLHRNIDPDYQVQFVELLAYSFEDQQEHVFDFIDIFSKGCIQICGRGIQLLPLLERIIQREQAKDIMFFGSLKHQSILFKHLFKQLEEERIIKLDEETINELLEVNEEQYLIKSKQPRVVNTTEEAEKRLLSYWQKFAQSNTGEIFPSFHPMVPSCQTLGKLLQLFKIKCLTPAQMISFQTMKEQFKYKRIFQNFSTGTGKTTLSLIWMLYSLIQLKTKSISCYESEELCENDYSKLYKEAANFYPSMCLISKEEHLQTFVGADIIFVTTSLLQRLLQHELMEHTFQQYQLVLDEFDAVLFDNQNTKQIVELFLKFNYFMAFTGSPLDIVHKNTVTKHLGGIILTYPSLEALEGKDNICKGKEVYDKRPKQIGAIVQLCEAQTLSTPVLVILDEPGYNTFSRKMLTNKLPLISLAETTPTSVISLLSSSVIAPQNGRYNTFILNVKQGRGLDVPTSTAIEKAGGVYIVIAVLPRTFRELEQFKGRTRRMGGKGQYSIILWEKTKNQTAETFLQQRLEAASMEELQRLARQYASIKALPLQDHQDAEQAYSQDEIKQNIEAECFEKDQMQDTDMMNDAAKNPLLQNQDINITPSNKANTNFCADTSVEEIKKPLWQSEAEHISEKIALKEFAPQIQKECTHKQSLPAISVDSQLIGQKRVKNGAPFGFTTDAKEDNNFEESKGEQDGKKVTATKKRTIKTKEKKLSVNEQPTDKINSKRTKYEKISEEEMEGNSQKISSLSVVEGD